MVIIIIPLSWPTWFCLKSYNDTLNYSSLRGFDTMTMRCDDFNAFESADILDKS